MEFSLNGRFMPPSSDGVEACSGYARQIIQYHGDEQFALYEKLHPRAKNLEHLRRIGDDVADAAARIASVRLQKEPSGNSATTNLHSHNGYNLLATMLEAESKGIASKDEMAFLASARAVPAWADWEAADRGVRVFLAMTLPAGLALLHSSLVGGFSAPRIARILRRTGYLSGPPSQSSRRVFETLSFVAAMLRPGALKPGGKDTSGWTACVATRLVHSTVRIRLQRVREASVDGQGEGVNPNRGWGEANPDPGPSHSNPGPSHSNPGPSHSNPGPSHSNPGPSHSNLGPSHSNPGPSVTQKEKSRGQAEQASQKRIKAIVAAAKKTGESLGCQGKQADSQTEVPINQEDLLATALAFSAVVLAGCEQQTALPSNDSLLWRALGIPLPGAGGAAGEDTVLLRAQHGLRGRAWQACSDYIHLWRLVGHFLGLNEDILGPPEAPLDEGTSKPGSGTSAERQRHVHPGAPVPTPFRGFQPLRDADTALAALRAILVHLTLRPDAGSIALAGNVLGGMAGEFPFYWPLRLHAGVARQIAGRGLCDSLGVGPLGVGNKGEAAEVAAAACEARARLRVYAWVAAAVWVLVVADWAMKVVWEWAAGLYGRGSGGRTAGGATVGGWGGLPWVLRLQQGVLARVAAVGVAKARKRGVTGAGGSCAGVQREGHPSLLWRCVGWVVAGVSVDSGPERAGIFACDACEWVAVLVVVLGAVAIMVWWGIGLLEDDSHGTALSGDL